MKIMHIIGLIVRSGIKKDTQAIQNGVIGARMGCEQGLMGVNKRVLRQERQGTWMMDE